jgi:predicted nucleotidyltransferase
MTDPILEREPKLAEAVRRLVAAYQPERIYPFGSAARGHVGPDSDYDILIVVPDDAPPERRDGGLAYRALWGVGTAVDAVVCTSGWPTPERISNRHFPARSCVKGACSIPHDPVRLADTRAWLANADIQVE